MTPARLAAPMEQHGSRLGRLFTWSKSSHITPQENFCTEALRIAIDDDPAPMIEALRRLAETVGRPLRLDLTMRTASQVSIRGGTLDVVVQFMDDREHVHDEIWVEVKVGCRESGNQLDCYLGEAKRRAESARLAAAALDHHARTREGTRHHPQPQLEAALRLRTARRGRPSQLVAASPLEGPGDILAEEQHVATDALAPISDADAGSLEPAFHLIGKVVEVLTEVHDGFARSLGDEMAGTLQLRWAVRGAFVNSVSTYFRSEGAMKTVSGPRRMASIPRTERPTGASRWTRESSSAVQSCAPFSTQRPPQQRNWRRRGTGGIRGPRR